MDSDSKDDENWRKSGNHGVLNSLRMWGVPKDTMTRIQTALTPAPGGEPIRSSLNFPEEFSSIGCVLLVALGRNTYTTIDDLHIGARHLQVTVGFRTTIFRNLTIGVREFGAFWVNLAHDPKIKKLTIFTELRDFGGANFFRFKHALAHNTFLRGLNIYSSSIQGKNPCTEFETYGRPSGSSNVFERAMPAEALSHLMTFLKESELESLGIIAFPEDIALVAHLLAAPTTILKSLTVIYVPGSPEVDDAVLAVLADAFRKNASLKSIEFECAAQRSRLDSHTTITNTWGDTLLAPFTQERGPSAHRNCGVNRLFFAEFPSHAVETLCSVLRTNETLQTVGLRHSRLQPREWIEILGSLRGNDSLDHLDLSFCFGLKREVFDEMMSLLYTNDRLQSIVLIETELQSELQSKVNEEIRLNGECRTNMVARRNGNIVFCGRPHAGKTRMRETWQWLESDTRDREEHRQRHPLTAIFFPNSRQGAVKAFLRSHPNVLLKLDSGKHDLREEPKITVIGNAPDITSIWDIPGRREFNVLHDRMVPTGRNSCFLYVCNVRDASNSKGDYVVRKGEDIRDEFKHWLHFMASKSNHVKHQHGQSQRLSVTFVMTNVDDLGAKQRSQLSDYLTEIVKQFRDDFKTLLDISDTVKFIDVRRPKHVKRVADGLKDRLATILADSTEYEVCATVRDTLQSDNPSEPILTLERVKDLCARGALFRQLRYHGSRRARTSKDRQVAFEEGLKIVLKYLNDAGDIIFVEGLKFVIVQVPWFVQKFLGCLVYPFQGSRATQGTRTFRLLKPTPKDAGTVHHEMGFVRRSRVAEFLQGVSSSNIYHEFFIDLMIHWGICFHEFEVPGNRYDGSSSDGNPRLFFPALLGNYGGDRDSSSETLKWTLQANSDFCYVGRRFESEESPRDRESSMVLRPDFFHRLQVQLLHYFREQKWHFAVSKMSQNVIQFGGGGMEVIVESSGNIGYFVDILVKSTEGFQQTVDFISDHVETKIVELWTSPQGCPGVNLVKSVIRPPCVIRPFCCEERKDHSVPISSLENSKPGSKYSWPVKIESVRDYDPVAELLSGPAIASPSRGNPTTNRNYVNLPAGLPAKFYVTIEGVNVIQRAEAYLNTARSIPVKLHVLCDGTDSELAHQIGGQPGRVVSLVKDSKDLNVPLLRYAKTMLYEGTKIVGGVLFHMGSTEMIDDFVAKLFTTPSLDVDLRTLQAIAGASGNVPTANILKMLERYLHACPNFAWLKEFLKVEDVDAFQRDFQLRKMTDPRTEKDLFLCEEHFIQVNRAFYSAYSGT